MSVPALFLPIASGPATPATRTIYPTIIQHGWEYYFRSVAALVERWKIDLVLIHLPHGLSYVKWPDRSPYRDYMNKFVGRQDIDAYRFCLDDGLLNVTNNEELRSSLMNLKSINSNLKIHMYVGPYSNINRPPSYSQLHEYFEPFIPNGIDRPVDVVHIDGESHIDRQRHRQSIVDSMNKLELTYGTEPLDPSDFRVPSVTLASSYDFYSHPFFIPTIAPPEQYRSSHIWIDNKRNQFTDPEYWEAYQLHNRYFRVALPPQGFNFLESYPEILNPPENPSGE